MKIKRFENISEKLSSGLREYIDNLIEYVYDMDVVDWIMNEPSFTNEIIGDISKEYLDYRERKEKLEKELKTIEAKINILKYEAGSELMYNFQEYLLKNDTDKFYELFIKVCDKEDYDEDSYCDTHPLILKKYRKELKNLIGMYKNLKNYNL